MVQVRRGFKTEAEAISREVRAELDIRTTGRLDPCALAEQLAIPVIPLSRLRGLRPPGSAISKRLSPRCSPR